MNDSTGSSKGLTVTARGDAVIPRAGAAALRLTADRTGLTAALSQVRRRDGFTPGHDRGRVLADAAVMMADGGNTVRGIDVAPAENPIRPAERRCGGVGDVGPVLGAGPGRSW